MAPSSKQPFLNMNTPVLLIQVPGSVNKRQPHVVSMKTHSGPHLKYVCIWKVIGVGVKRVNGPYL